MKIKAFYSDQNHHLEELKPSFSNGEDIINLEFDLSTRYQTHLGFGGSFTDAACITFNSLSKDKQEEYLKAYFSNEGLGYNLARYPLGSCDFSTHNYQYLEDKDISHLSIECDKERIEFVNRAKKYSPNLELFASPWSPAKFMKTNGDMNQGGKLKKEYYPLWSKVLISSVKKLNEKGLNIRYLNIQNEPLATQTWDSCIYTGLEEADFIKNYVIPEKNMQNLDINIMIWDHNRDVLIDRINETFSKDLEIKDIYGVTYHWYSNKDFEQVSKLHEIYPSLHLVMSEGCVELLIYGNAGSFEHAERYAHQIINDLSNYCEAYIDWNLSLDLEGGPNHVGNLCEALLMIDKENDRIIYNPTYYAVGQFSKFIKPGDTRIFSSIDDPEIEVVAYQKVSGEIVCVLLNMSDSLKTISVYNSVFTLPLHSITTILL